MCVRWEDHLTECKCEWHHAMDWGPELNKEIKLSPSSYCLCFPDGGCDVTSCLMLRTPCLHHHDGLYPRTVSHRHPLCHTLCHSHETRSDKHIHCVSMVTHGLLHHSSTFLVFFISFFSLSPPMISSLLDLSHPPSGTVPHSVITNYWPLASSSQFQEVYCDSGLVIFLVLLTPGLTELIVITLGARHCFCYLSFIVFPPHVHSAPPIFHRKS